MKAYTSIREAVSDLKARTGHGYVSYFVNGTQVGAADYRMAEGEETIYRNGEFVGGTRVSRRHLRRN